ncbi:hypothetical protein MNBD_GAMMA06-1670 [hydrothermal vent metagenome]|uniref:YhdP central domain-containing protein n=1 Tax=hydrothermal vent metagenome TaxID=652676 RepID=A0A3B0W5N8_9ZZZZ
MQWILRLRICITICLAVTLISAAVVFSVLRAVLPYATGYKNEIQLEISRQIGLPVEIESIDAAIHGFSPRLKLLKVSVFDEKNKIPLFNFKEAFVELDIIGSIMHRDFIVADVGLVGADISIEKLSENEWLVQGIKFSSKGASELPDKFLYMLQNADYLLHDSNIYYQDHTGDKLNISLLDINMDVENSFNNHEIKFSMNLPEDFGESLVVVADLNGEIDSLDGEIYVEAKKLKVKQWNKKFNLLDEYQIDTVLDVSIWSTLEESNVQDFVAQLTAKKLSVKNNKTARRWGADYLTTNLRFAKKEDNWNLTVSDFYFGTEKEAKWGRSVSFLASGDKEYYYVSADFLRLADLEEISSVFLTPELNEKLKGVNEYLSTRQVAADIYNFSLKIPKNMSEKNLLDKLILETSVNDFSMRDDEKGFAFSGFDASFQYNNKQMVVDLQTDNADVEWQKFFRQPVSAEILQGILTFDFNDDTLQVASSQLQLKNAHINSYSRFDLQILSDNTIFVDAQTNFYDVYGKYVTQYLPVDIMTPALVEWLDMAVTDGYVANGTFILRGDLNDFPYKNNEGVFQMLLPLQDVNMKFMEEWPLLTDASGILKFNNQSLVLTNAKGKTLDVQMFNGRAEFLDITVPHLTFKTDARGKNEELQRYIWNSPLNETLGDTMHLFQFKGDNNLSLTLEVPLDEDEIEVTFDGHLTFIDTEIYYPALGYGISDVNGTVDFTKTSVFADSIIAKVNNQPTTINAFTENGDFGPQVVFHLDSDVGIDYLLQRYDWVPKNWLTGSSAWSMDIEMPYDPKNYLVHIKANSYLDGTSIGISDKVSKIGSKKLQFSADINILDGNGLQVNAKITDDKINANDKTDQQDKNIVMDLFATRNDDELWRFDIKSTYITGKGEFTEGLGKDTQLKLDLDEIDMHALFVSENKKNSKPLIPSDFPPLRWKVGKVLWDNWTFTDVKVEADWHKHGMLINSFTLKGPAMSFDARGTWLTSWNGSHETVMNGNISSHNCGETLVGLGYQRSLDRCGYEASFDSKWPAEPYGLSWANMKGKTSFEMTDGEILEVDPGTGGRLLGMLNIFKLANRLAFDFDDVTRKGFSFDSIKGEFEFVNGDGSLRNFDVSAPAADINMFGSIGMVKHDYGLLMRVKPHTDTLTFAGATLLGGVVIGAGLALIQNVFDLGVIGHNVYSITGTWDKPVIEKIVERNEDDADDEDF